MVTKPTRIFKATSPLTQTTDTYTYFPSLLEMSLLQQPVPMTWQTTVHRRHEHHFSSMLFNKSRSPHPVETGDHFSSPPRSTRGARTIVLMLQEGQTSASMWERKVARTRAEDLALAKQNHNPRNFCRWPKTTLIWEQSLLFSGISLFRLSIIINTWMGWKSLWGIGKGGAGCDCFESPDFWITPDWNLPPNKDKGWCLDKILHL